MPFKNGVWICITKEIKAQLDSYREEGESWNKFMAKIIRLIEQNIEEEAKKEA